MSARSAIESIERVGVTVSLPPSCTANAGSSAKRSAGRVPRDAGCRPWMQERNRGRRAVLPLPCAPWRSANSPSPTATPSTWCRTATRAAGSPSGTGPTSCRRGRRPRPDRWPRPTTASPPAACCAASTSRWCRPVRPSTSTAPPGGCSTSSSTSGSARPRSACTTPSSSTASSRARSTSPRGSATPSCRWPTAPRSPTWSPAATTRPGVRHPPAGPGARPAVAGRRGARAVRQGPRRTHPRRGARAGPAADLAECTARYAELRAR